MTDKIVTHEDLPALRGIREAATSPTTYYPDDTTAKLTPLALLDRLIAAAEADVPLPEGWVLLTVAPHVQQVVWHEAGTLYRWSDCSTTVDDVEQVGGRGRLTPLRPIITEADVEKAAQAARAAWFEGMNALDAADPDMRDVWMRTVRAAFWAADIEVI